jgi:hypothetical protein
MYKWGIGSGSNADVMSRVVLGCEYFIGIFNDKLNGIVLRMHVGHFAFQIVVSHDGRREDNCKVFGSHLACVSVNV